MYLQNISRDFFPLLNMTFKHFSMIYLQSNLQTAPCMSKSLLFIMGEHEPNLSLKELKVEGKELISID